MSNHSALTLGVHALGETQEGPFEQNLNYMNLSFDLRAWKAFPSFTEPEH